MIRTVYPPLTPPELERMEQDARRFQGAYTGTSGTLAAHVIRLLAERQQLAELVAIERGKRDAKPAYPCLSAY